jgi:hypothetical protein
VRGESEDVTGESEDASGQGCRRLDPSYLSPLTSYLHTSHLIPLTSYLLLLTTACHSSPQQKLQQTQQQLESWNATERLTVELASRGALPSVYVRQVREAVEQGRRKAQQQAAKISGGA